VWVGETVVVEDLRQQLRQLVDASRDELVKIPGVLGVRLSETSNDIIIEVEPGVPDDKLTWIQLEGRRRLGNFPVVAKRKSR